MNNDSKENKGVIGIRGKRRNARTAQQMSLPLSATSKVTENQQQSQASSGAVKVKVDNDSDSSLDREEAEYQSKLQQATRSKGKKPKSEKQQKKDAAREEWFDPTKFDTKRVKHPPVVKKPVPLDDDVIFCNKCKTVFDTVDNLCDHEKNCFKGRRYPCTWKGCNHVNSQWSLMHQHVKAVHYNDPFQCHICPNETFIYKKSMDKHVKTNHDLEKTYKYNCPECAKGTDDKAEYTIHMDRHQNVKRYKCNVCDQAFFSQWQLTNHTKTSCVVANSTTSCQFECSVCGQVLKTEDRYREHFKWQHVDNENPKPFFCELCILRMWTIKGFKKHTDKCEG